LNLPSKGEATYRLVIDTAREEELLGISIPELYTEYALYINGQLLVGNGELGSTAFRFLDPDAFMFEPGSDRIEIVLQIRNTSHVNAGIGQSLVLGTPDRIFWKDAVEAAVDLILAGICLFAGMYHFVLFLYRRKDYKLLCFTAFCVAVAVRGLLSNATYIMDFFPELPFVIGSRIVTVSIPVLTASMLLYVYFIFRENLSKWIVRILVSVNVLYVFVVLLTEPYVYSTVFVWYLAVPMITCAIGLYVGVLSMGGKSREAVLFLVGTLCIVVGTVNDALVFLQMIDTGYRLGVGLAAFAVIQSFIMAMQHTRFIKERKQLYDRLHETDLAFLQAQIKPHFIYNALSAISHMTETEPKKAKALLLDFSDYLRGSFDFNNTSGLTTLSKEMDLAKSYLSIEKARFRERLNVEYDIEENPQVLIPMLCIQPVVENAVRHGLMKKAKGGTVKIKVWSEKGDTHIRVEDDGVGIPKDQIEEILNNRASAGGLANINGRLKLKFGTGLMIRSRRNEGTMVEIIVPINSFVR
ncbi:MAG: 7TM diverse intracellular signaling domain-containing protein, partial [Eubacteriales bacterium]|nr:7TM diverse intracellular signaling domain-containing protein [Eubacteriales bacterium]